MYIESLSNKKFYQRSCMIILTDLPNAIKKMLDKISFHKHFKYGWVIAVWRLCLIYSTIPLGTPVLKFFIYFLACVFNSLPVLAMNYLRCLIINHTLNKKAVSSSVHIKLDYWPCARNLKLRGNTRTSCWCSHAIYSFWQTSPGVSITL